MVTTQHSDLSLQRFPRFISFLKPLDCDSNRLGMPDSFIVGYGDEVPSNVRLQFPNGRQFDVHYTKNEKALYHVGLMYKEFNCRVGSCVLLCYKGNGNFLVNLLSNGRSEIEYGVLERLPRAQVLTQDPIGGKGWKFYTYGIGPVLRDGGTDIPKSFWKRFRIPTSVTFVMSNGELHQGFYSTGERKLYGLLPIVKKKYVKLWDILMFTYSGDGKFEICVFEKRVEKFFKPDPLPVDSDSSSDSDSSDDEVDLTEPDNLHQIVVSDEEANNMDIQFAVTMNVSHVDNRSHGVYIPRSISPNNREWRVGEELILTTSKGAWTVGLVRSSGNMRLSSGWNRFVRENEIELNNTLLFILAKDEVEGVEFHVEIEDNN